ncbi:MULTISPECIES: hypothetical protein [Corallococcus]|uniref:hypothetical protein n=1 Tax=Corallococcus TaxID=83461 RepID=UPI0011C4A8B0|nr:MULTISPECIES: hypothetical protein [Corallococcus]
MSSAGGSLDRLLWNGLHPGVYSLSECEVGARLAPVNKEAVLLFQLDSPHDELRHGEPDGTQVCDGLFFYRRKKNAHPWLLFFELKRGRDFDHAVSQLISAVRLALTGLHARCDQRRVHAVIISGAESPPDSQLLQKEFRQQLLAYKIKATLGFVPCPLKGVADLREELMSRVQAVENIEK